MQVSAQLRRHLEAADTILKKTFWYARDAKMQGYLDHYPLYIATSTDRNAILVFESGWKDLNKISLGGFVDLVWNCLVEQKPLRTMIMTEAELERLEEKEKVQEKRLQHWFKEEGEKAKEEEERLEQRLKDEEEHERKDDLVSR